MLVQSTKPHISSTKKIILLLRNSKMQFHAEIVLLACIIGMWWYIPYATGSYAGFPQGYGLMISAMSRDAPGIVKYWGGNPIVSIIHLFVYPGLHYLDKTTVVPHAAPGGEPARAIAIVLGRLVTFYGFLLLQLSCLRYILLRSLRSVAQIQTQ